MSLADLYEYEGLEEPPEEDGWPAPEDADQAERYGRMLCHVRSQRVDIAKLASAEHARINRWEEERDRPLREKEEWLERAIAAWGRQVNADDPSVKTIRLPHVEVLIRPAQTRVLATSDQKVLASVAQLAPELLRQKWEADKRYIAKSAQPGKVVATTEDEDHHEAVLREVSADGEVRELVLPGILLAVPHQDKVTVKPVVE